MIYKFNAILIKNPKDIFTEVGKMTFFFFQFLAPPHGTCSPWSGVEVQVLTTGPAGKLLKFILIFKF